MSFQIFATGYSPKYHYENDNCVDGSYFDTIKLISTLSSMSPTKGGVIATGADSIIPQADMIDAMAVYAQIECLHQLKNAVDWLATKSSNASEGGITVTIRENHLLWTPTIRTARYCFFPGDDPGTEFVKAIIKPLKDSSMNTWGTLRALQGVLNAFGDNYDDAIGHPNMLIMLEK